MNPFQSSRRAAGRVRTILGVLTVAIFALVLPAVVSLGRTPPGDIGRMELTPAPEWPMRGGTLQRNMVQFSPRPMLADWDVRTGRNIKWAVKLGSHAYGGPVVCGGKIYVGTNNDSPRDPAIKGDKGIIMCFDEATGKFLWQAVHDKLETGRANDWPLQGIFSTPAVERHRLYYVSNRCELVCADTEGFLDGKNDGVRDEQHQGPTDADIVWRLDMIGELGVYPHNLAVSSPLVVGDLVFVHTGNGVDESHIKVPAPKAPSFLAVHKRTGKVVWSDNSPTARLLEPGADPSRLMATGGALMHGQWSSPAYAVVRGEPQVIFPGGDGWIYAFRPTSGKLLWKFDGNPKDSVYELGGKGTRSDYIATPVVHEDRLYIGVGHDPEHDAGVGHFWCIDLLKATKNGGDVSPELPTKKKGEKGKPNPKLAAAWEYGGLDANDPRGYKFGRTMSTASVHNGLCFIAEQEGILHCLDAKTGKEYWQHDMNAGTWSSPYTVDGKVYMGNDKNVLYIFEHSTTEKIIAKIKMGQKVRATPVVANGVLYVMTDGNLYAIGMTR
jgi:outer membrane protein assembly factor BamB